MIDTSVHNQSFIEDCQVCCNPLEFDLIIQDNILQSFSVKSIGQ